MKGSQLPSQSPKVGRLVAYLLSKSPAADFRPHRRVLPQRLAVLILGLGSLIFPSIAKAQEPSVEYSSLMDAVRIHPSTGAITLDKFFSVFIPKEVRYTGANLVRDRNQCYAVLNATPSGKEVGRWPLLNENLDAVFSTLRPVGAQSQATITEPGQFILSVQIDETVLTQVAIQIEVKRSDDPFDPGIQTFMDGPWSTLACLRLGDVGSPEGYPSFRFWLRGGKFNLSGKEETVEVDILHEGHVVFTTQSNKIGAQGHMSKWNKQDRRFQFPVGSGSGPVRNKDLMQKDGSYQVAVTRAGKPYAQYSFEVHEGDIVPHARQNLQHRPHVEYLCARVPGMRNARPMDLVWMDRKVPTEQTTEPQHLTTVATSITPEQRAAWRVEPSTPEDRRFAIHLTTVSARMDAGIAAGDGIVAFGTGPNKGVAYLQAGDPTEHMLPHGPDWSATLFGVCGKKIVLTRGSQVAVYDTVTETLHEIPIDQIHLSRSYAKFYGPWPISINGNLIATINDANKVADRRSIKVIDVSGEVPQVIVLRNPAAPFMELNSIAVEAATGTLAIGWNRGKALWIANVACEAQPIRVDLSQHDGFGNDSPMQIAGGRILYFDDAGSRRLRFVDSQTQAIQTIGGLGKAGRHFVASPLGLAYMTEKGRGSNYQFEVGSISEGSVATQEANNVGESAPGNGNFGMGTSAALTEGGVCFLAGQGKSGIGSGEVLQVVQGNRWSVLAGPDGQAVPAVDVVAGQRMIAFKTGAGSDARIGYALFGATLPAASIPSASE